MSDKILIQAKQAMSQLVSQCCRDIMVRPFDNVQPVSPSLLNMLVAWMVPALDFVMTGTSRVKLADKKFINQITCLNLTLDSIDRLSGREANSAGFDPAIPPAFILLAERIEVGAGQLMYPQLDILFNSACAWDGDRSLADIQRIESLLRPIRAALKMGGADGLLEDDNVPIPMEQSVSKACSEDNEAEKGTTATLVVADEIKNPQGKLDALIGLTEVKEQVRNLTNLAHSVPAEPSPHSRGHMRHPGPPGADEQHCHWRWLSSRWHPIPIHRSIRYSSKQSLLTAPITRHGLFTQKD